MSLTLKMRYMLTYDLQKIRLGAEPRLQELLIPELHKYPRTLTTELHFMHGLYEFECSRT